MSKFDAGDYASKGKSEVVGGLDKLSLAQLKAVLEAEEARGKGGRKTVVPAIEAAIETAEAAFQAKLDGQEEWEVKEVLETYFDQLPEVVSSIFSIRFLEVLKGREEKGKNRPEALAVIEARIAKGKAAKGKGKAERRRKAEEAVTKARAGIDRILKYASQDARDRCTGALTTLREAEEDFVYGKYHQAMKAYSAWETVSQEGCLENRRQARSAQRDADKGDSQAFARETYGKAERAMAEAEKLCAGARMAKKGSGKLFDTAAYHFRQSRNLFEDAAKEAESVRFAIVGRQARQPQKGDGPRRGTRKQKRARQKATRMDQAAALGGM